MTGDRHVLHKEDPQDVLDPRRGAIAKYREFFVGRPGLWNLFQYELAQVVAAPMPGALGFALRRLLIGNLLGEVGSGVNFGRNLTLRHPGKMSIGDRTGIDDLCLLDARGVRPGEFVIGSDVIIARGTMLAAKTDRGAITIGDNSTVGKGCQLASTGGVHLGKWVAVSGMCYLGGGLYRTDDLDTPIMKQELYTRGPVVIGDDCWLGAGVTVLDGVEIGSGSIIGAGAVVRESVPPRTLVMPRGGNIVMPRASEAAAPAPAPAATRPPSDASDLALRCVYRALESVNRTRPPDRRFELSTETALLEDGALDSLAAVTLVVETELALEEEFGRPIDLGNGAPADGAAPLATVGTLVAHVRALVDG